MENFYVNEEDLKFYDKFMECTNKGMVLDLGCGNGQVSNYLTKFGYECIGYDISDKMIELGKKLNPKLNINVGDIENIPLLNNKAVGAIYAYSLPNLTNW